MDKGESQSERDARQPQEFAETQWSLVIAAGGQTSPKAAIALETLCARYWYPLYLYVRRRGYSAHDAQDLTQEFFSRLLKNNCFARADRERGKFRSYLLGALNHFLADDWDKAHAQKRGSGQKLLFLDDAIAERTYLQEAASDLTPEKAYDKRWALTLLTQALKRLREELRASGKAGQFDVLKNFLTSEPDDGEYAKVAKQLGMSTKSVAVAVHRLRGRFRTFLREELAHTVSDPKQVDEELRYLFCN